MDVGLGIAVHEVQQIATGHILQVYINSLCHIGGSLQTVGHGCGLGLTVEVQNSAVTLIHTHLIGSTCHRIGYHSRITACGRCYRSISAFGRCGAGTAVVHSVETGGELGAVHIAGIVTGNVGGVGHAKGGVSTVGTHVVGIVAIVVIDQSVGGLVVGIDIAGSSSYKLQAALAPTGIAIGTMEHMDVGLGIAVHEVQQIAVIHTLQVHIHSLCHIGGSLQTVSDGFRLSLTVEVQNCAVALIHTHLVSSTYHRIGHIGYITGIGRCYRCVAAFGRCGTGANGNIIYTGLICHRGDLEAVCSFLQIHHDQQILNGHNHIGSACQRIHDRLYPVSESNIEHDPSHFGILNGQRSVLVETGRRCIVSNGLVGACLVVGNGNAIFLPNLLIRREGHTVCLVGKADGYAILSRIGAAALTGSHSIQHTTLVKLNLVVVLDDLAGDGNGVAHLQTGYISSTAGQAVSLDGHILAAFHLHGDGDVLILGTVRTIHAGDHTSQGVLTFQLAAGFQSISRFQNLCGSHIVAGVVAFHQLSNGSTCAKLDTTLIVHDHATDGNGVAHANLGTVIVTGLDAIAVQIGAIGQIHVQGQVAIAGIVSGGDLGDLTGQICIVRQALAVCQLCRIGQDRSLVGGFGLSHAAAGHTLLQGATGIELDGALIVLDDATNGDGITHSDLGCIICAALQTVAQHLNVVLATHFHSSGIFHRHVHRDVTILLVVGGVNAGDLAGQGSVVRQALALSQCLGIGQDGHSIGGLGLCHAAAALAGLQGTACAILQIALIVLHNTADGNGIAHSDLGAVSSTALQTVAQNADSLAGGGILHIHVHGDVAIVLIVRGINGSNLTGQAGVEGQLLALAQLVGIGEDGLGMGGLGLGVAAAADAVEHGAAAAELQLALVVLNDTLDGDGVAHSDLLYALTLHAVADDGTGIAVDLDDHGDVVVFLIVGGVDLDDLTGQSCVVVQVLTGAELRSIGHDLSGIGGGLFCLTAAADAIQQHTAGIELDLALVILDDTLNGNDIVHCDLIAAGTLQTVAGDGLLLSTLHHEYDGNVAVLGIVGGLDLSDLTGQSRGVRQDLAVLQRIGLLNDLQRILGSFHSVTLLVAFQDAAGIKLDGAVVVLDGAGNGDDVAKVDDIHALALQTVALNGILLVALHDDGDGDVLEIGVVHLVDGNDLTGQSDLVGQALAGLQSISLLQHLAHINGLGLDVVPAISNGITALIGDRSGQCVGSVLLTLLVNVDDDSLTLAGSDLDRVQVHGPGDLKGLAAHADHGITLIIPGCGDSFIRTLVQRLQVLHCRLGSDVLFRCGFGSLRCFFALAAREQAQDQSNQKQPR